MCFDQWIRVAEALAWPLTAVVVFVALRPWRLVDHLIKQGGSFEAAGIKVDLTAKIRDAQNAAGAAPVPAPAAHMEPGPVAVDDDEENAASIDPYSLIISSWSGLVGALDAALERAGIEVRDWRGPVPLLNTLRQHGALNEGLLQAARDLLDVRNQVKRNGPSNFSRLGISSLDAERFAGSARTIKAAVDAWNNNQAAQPPQDG